VVLTHKDNHAICLKATSQVDAYKNNASKMAGVVHYHEGSPPCFPLETVVQPDNQVAIAHGDILGQQKLGTFKLEGPLPKDFPERLKKAVALSETMSPRHQKRFTEMLGL
jgi:hypothetical protein